MYIIYEIKKVHILGKNINADIPEYDSVGRCQGQSHSTPCDEC